LVIRYRPLENSWISFGGNGKGVLLVETGIVGEGKIPILVETC